MLQIFKGITAMDHRVRFVCPFCGSTHIAFSYPRTNCPVCKMKIPNVFLITSDDKCKKDYYFGSSE